VAHDRGYLLEGHGEDVVQDKGDVLGRGRRLEDYQQGEADRVGQHEVALGVRRFVATDDRGAGPRGGSAPRAALAQDAGVAPEGSGFRGFTLSFIVDTAETVDATLAQAERAGGKVLKPRQAAQWGGYFGYFADPDGYLWKVAASAT
jgi:uncharacterized glyoxalase superfamily protein PhnB